MLDEKHSWVSLYQAALLELDQERLQERVREARDAIEERIRELGHNARSSERTEEHHALWDALRTLKVLLEAES